MAKKNSSIFAVIQGIADNAIITGTADADTITTTFNNNTINAGGGNDSITTTLTNRSDDLLIYQYGQDGRDSHSVVVNAASRYLGSVADGGAGADVITTNTTLTNPYTDTLLETYAVGGGGDDLINMTAALNSGGLLWQEVYAGAGVDTVTMNASTTGGAGTTAYNYAEGGTGNDSITATVAGGAGSDHFNELYGEGDDDTLVGIVTGTEGYSALYGGSGNDSLRVYGGNANELYGGTGNDILRGGTGDDTFTGGAGIDTFWIGSGGNDVITDFNFGLLGTFIGSDRFAFEDGINPALVEVTVNPQNLLQISLAGNPLVTLAGSQGTAVDILQDLLDLLFPGAPVTGEVPG
jgi:Ca2+-binding RTX toxin-like protein